MLKIIELSKIARHVIKHLKPILDMLGIAAKIAINENANAA
jgi:hypothetical protein